MAIPLKEKISVLIDLIKNRKVLRALLSLRHSGYFADIGWFNSFFAKASVGKNGEPIPWVTYPFIDFILTRLNKTFTVFEYGAGNSTLFYAKYVKRIVAVEHNKEWYQKIKNVLSKNAEIIFKDENSPDYEKAILFTEQRYDIIIIDAQKRVECLKYSLERLNESGVIILDDSDREEYSEAFLITNKNGFRHLDFWGISPGYLNRKATTVFYRGKNCLGI
jgi:hypothetical protein